MNPKILIIIPAYNAAKYLVELIQRITPYASIEDILIINDGSSDNTEEIIQSMDCRKISFPENRGKGAALKVGFTVALQNGYDAVITIDADLQHIPERLNVFREQFTSADLIIGTRNIKTRRMPLERQLTNNLTSLIISIFGSMRIRDSQSGYRMIKTSVLRNLRLTADRYDTESEMLFQTGYLGHTAGEVAIPTVYEGSHSFINPFKDTTRFIRQIWRRLWY
ncbi:MAG: glycosyltransferase family 2 protein [FCB group bacterium]|nr:glycosyltransferase family 2 protein [FCB group bacterium]